MVVVGKVNGSIIELEKSASGHLKDGSDVEIIPINQTREADVFCGAWDDSRTADEIIRDLRDSRHNKTTSPSL